MLHQKSKGKLNVERSASIDSPELIRQQTQPAPDISDQDQKISPKKQQHTVHEFILTEFKQKYDQLKNQFQQKKKQSDNLMSKNKKLEIEVLSQNVDYYDHQITRLKTQVQKFQLQNEENKYKRLIAQNARNDLEATAQVKKDQLKQVLKQLEKQKVAVVELRHQLAEKDRNFHRIVDQLQSSNTTGNQKYDQTSAKLSKADSQLKIKNIEVDQLRREVQRKDKEFNKLKVEAANQKQKYELQDYRLNNRLADLEEDIKQYKSKQNQTIRKLEAQVKQYEKRCASQQVILADKNTKVEEIKNAREKEVIIATLQQNIRELEIIVANKNSEINNIQLKLEGVVPASALKESQDRYSQMLTRYKATEKYLQNKAIQLEKQLTFLKLSKRETVPDTPVSGNFQQLLRNQIEQNSRIKAEAKSKIEEIYNLKNTIEEQQIKMGLLQNEVEILKKRQKADEKNNKIEFEIEIQNLRNEIQTLRRKLEVTETKFNIKIKEVKDKDTFITNVMIGRSKQQDVPFVLAQLKRIFEADYASKLSEANLRISDLQAKLSH